tara:strand:- start:840 stop:1064 length:225 start_codon:yes stop_codon:yes gene_type:complete
MLIEKDVPIPSKKSKYNFDSMDVGESFTIPNKEPEATRLRVAASAYSRRHEEFKFTTRALGEVLRIWRIDNDKF